MLPYLAGLYYVNPMNEVEPVTITWARCTRCHRKLHAAASKARGYGRFCWGRVIAKLAQLGGFTAEQLGKARELLEDGGLVRIRGAIARVTSSDGTATYMTAASGPCNCASGSRTRPARACYHVATVRAVFT